LLPPLSIEVDDETYSSEDLDNPHKKQKVEAWRPKVPCLDIAKASLLRKQRLEDDLQAAKAYHAKFVDNLEQVNKLAEQHKIIHRRAYHTLLFNIKLYGKPFPTFLFFLTQCRP
jgi:hypothetical protein